MKSILKVAPAMVALFVLITSAAAVTVHTQTFTYFTDANGNVGFVYVIRATDPTTNVTTTNLSYSFCVQTTAASCLEGSGLIPNQDFKGKLTTDVHRADVLTLVADTSTIAGFENLICNGGPDEFGGCVDGTSPGTGGPISLTWVKKRGTIETLNFEDFKRENYRITLDSSDATSQGAVAAQGTVLGTSVSVPDTGGSSWSLETLSGKGTPGDNAAVVHLMLQKSVEKALPGKTTDTVRRLERLLKVPSR